MPTLSIIIVNYNSKDILTCIQSAYATVTTPFELFVVDNNSTDDSVYHIKKTFPQVKLIENTLNKGYGAACNQAINLAQGNNLLILNPDIILEQTTVNELVQFLQQNTDAKIVSCALKNHDGTLQDSFRTFPTISSLLLRQITTLFRHKKIVTENLQKPTKVDWVSGACMLLRNKYYFDERFFLYFEDVDLCKRIGSVYHYPHVSATHLAQRESSKNARLALIHAKSTLQYFVKHLRT